MKNVLIAMVLVLFGGRLLAQDSPQASPRPGDDYSGMYSFRQDGEFVQLTVEGNGAVTGFVSRYGDGESDRGVFLDQFFKGGKLDGHQLTFTTETVHGVWFAFNGVADRGAGKTERDEDFYALKGTLTEFRSDADKKVTEKAREVVLKSFPRQNDSAPEKKPK